MSRIICGWDVGIKNLAYCVMDVTNNKILDLNIINLTKNNIIYCTICGKKGSFYQHVFDSNTSNNKINYYCGVHKKLCNNYQETFNNLIKNIDTKDKCEHNNCTKYAKFNYNNIKYCLAHKKSNLNKNIKDYSLQTFTSKSCYSNDLVTLLEVMYEELNKKDIFKIVNEIYIENQPTLKNPTMKSISMGLLSYFVWKKKDYNIKTIKFIAPSSKLKISIDNINIDSDLLKTIDKIKKLLNLTNIDIDNKLVISPIIDKDYFTQNNKLDKDKTNILLKNKHTYELTKLLAEKVARNIIIEKGKNFLEYYDSLTKKDDVADSIMHCMKKI